MEGLDKAIVLDVRGSGTIAWIGYSLCLCVLLVLLWNNWDVGIAGGAGLHGAGSIYFMFGYVPAMFLAGPACGYSGVEGYVTAKEFRLGPRVEALTLAPVLLLLITALLLHVMVFSIGGHFETAPFFIGGWVAMTAISGSMGFFFGRRRIRKAVASSAC